jgi:hypothetical protein
MADTGGRVDPPDGDGGFATPATTIAQRLSRQQRRLSTRREHAGGASGNRHRDATLMMLQLRRRGR